MADRKYTGTYYYNLDPKGRLVMPAKFRELLGESFIITTGFEGCLAVYSEEMFEKTTEQLERVQDLSNPDLRQLKRNIYSDAETVEADKQGRVLVSAYLRKMARLNTEVMLKGVGDHVEIWDEEVWKAYNEDFDYAQKAKTLTFSGA